MDPLKTRQNLNSNQ